MSGWMGYVVVALLATLVSVGELTQRYRDKPFKAIRRPPAVLYALVNIAASMGALYAIRLFGWSFNISPATAVPLVQVLVAGISALALFRLKLFTASAGKESISFAPTRLLEQLLDVADRQIDRGQATDRAALVQEFAEGLSFSRSAAALPAMALALLEHVDAQQQKDLGDDVKTLIEDNAVDEDVKLRLLVTAILRVTGPDVVRTAIDALGDTIR